MIMLYDQFRELSMQSVTLAINKANNCIRVKSGVALLQNILHSKRGNKNIFVVKKFLLLSDYYSYPLASSKLGIYVAKHLSESIQFLSFQNFEGKCFLLPLENHHVIFLLTHSI